MAVTMHLTQVGLSGSSGHSVGHLFYNLMCLKTSPRRLGSAEDTSHIGDSISSPFLSQRVFVWDLDETIIIFHSLLTGTFASRYGKVRIHFAILFFPKKITFIYLFAYSVCTCGSGSGCEHVWWPCKDVKVREQLEEISSHFPPCESRRWNPPMSSALAASSFTHSANLLAGPFRSFQM